MTGAEYREAIAHYLHATYGERGVQAMRSDRQEVKIAKTMVGKQRGVDAMRSDRLHHEPSNRAGGRSEGRG